ncbi:MAG: response regulator [Deltaproteobacteria bacterium]|nr:response regulator [Deltaproteobacteria bacterium]
MLLKKIVVAEDDDSVAHLVAATLGDAGFLCLRARDGDEAITLVRREAPDLLILDVMMPRLDGLEVARRLKSDLLASRTPILMLTALGSVDERIRGLDAGADDYLPKPFDLRELAARARALIRASRRERDRNPTTNLPGSTAVEDHVDALLKKKAACALLYLDIDHFEAYADAFGFHRADDVVAELGGLILERARAYAGASAFVGHVGGDDFLVVVDSVAAEELAQDLVESFDGRVARWYTGETSAEQMATRMTLSIAIVEAQKTGAKTTGELARFVAQAKRTSKKREGSNFVVWGEG